MKLLKRIVLIALAVILAILLASSVILGNLLFQLNRKSQALETDVQSLAQIYTQPLSAGPGEPITQQVSCGYAVIQMVSQWAGSPVTEAELEQAYKKVVTSSADGFCREMNKQVPAYETRQLTWLTDFQLLEAVCQSLEAGIPVPIQWAAQYEGQWTLHYSLVTGADLQNDRITVLNPYGLTETLTRQEFLDRTSFRAYEPMPLWLKLAFALDVFQKNTLFPMTLK